MNLNTYRPIFPFFWIVILCYILHRLVFFVFQTKIPSNNFQISLEQLYLGYSIFSIILFLILTTVKKKSFDNVGMLFLILITFKMVICFIFLNAFYVKSVNHYAIEKMNYFVMFMLFLAIETMFAIRILNNK